jgi:general secretion pathway protein G
MFLVSNERGFTLIELLIVIVIIGVLASISVPKLMGITEKARIEAITFNARTLVTEMEVYKFENDQYPSADGAKKFIENYRDELNALDSIVQELGTDGNYNYVTNTGNSDYVFSVKLPNGEFIGLSAEEGLKQDLEDHPSLNSEE